MPHVFAVFVGYTDDHLVGVYADRDAAVAAAVAYGDEQGFREDDRAVVSRLEVGSKPTTRWHEWTDESVQLWWDEYGRVEVAP